MATEPQDGNSGDSDDYGSFGDHYKKFGDNTYANSSQPGDDPDRPMAPIEDDEDTKKNEMDSEDLLDKESTEEDSDDSDEDDEDEFDNATGQDFYKENPDNKVAFSDRFSLKNAKKKDFWDVSTGGRRIFAMVGIAGFLMSMVVGLLMFMTIYRSEHLRNLLWDYRFAKFHYQISKRIEGNLVSAENLDPASTGTLEFEKTTLGQKLRGYSPEEAMKSLTEGEVKLTVEKGSLFGESKITGYTDPATKDRVISSNSREAKSGNIPEGTRVVDSATFESGLQSTAATALEDVPHAKYFQRQTRKLLSEKVDIKFGDRIAGWKERLKGEAAKNKTTEDKVSEKERQRLLAEEDLKTATAGKETTVGSTLDDKEKKVQEDIANDTPAPSATDLTTPSAKWANSETRASMAEGAGKIGEFSKEVFIITMGCIVRDLSGSLVNALSTRIDAPMRMAANMFGEAEQQKAGGSGASLDYAKQRNNDFDNIDQSAALQRINGTSENQIPDSAKMEVADFPLQFMGFSLRDVSNLASMVKSAVDAAATVGLSLIPGVSSISGPVIDWACKQVLRPEVQIAVAAIGVIGAALSLGSSKGFAEAGFRTLETVVSVAKGVGFGKIFFEYLIPKILFSISGSGGVMSAGDPQNGNKLDVGSTLLASQYGSMAGGSGISLAQAERDQDIAMGLVKKQKVDEMGAYAYISPTNPYSLTSQLALSLPGDPMKIPGALLTKSLGLLFSKSTLSSLGNIISPKAKAASGATYLETYGVQQTGISDQMMSLDPVQNALYVDGTPGKLQDLKTKYQKCFVDSLSSKALGDGYDICGDEDAQRLGLYNIDNCAGAGNLTQDTNANNCSIFDGAGDVVTESSSASSGSASNSAAAGSLVSAGAATVGSYKMPEIRHDSRQMDTCDAFDGTQPPEAGNVPIQYPGSKDLQWAVDDKFGGGAANEIMGSRGKITRCWNNSPDIHTTGRAVDEYFHTWRPEELAAGTQAFGWLVTNAKIIGLQYAKLWRVQWTPGQGFTCVDDPNDQIQHQDHLHFELNWDGALKKTAYFNGTAPAENAITIDEEICPKLYHKNGSQYILDAPPAVRN